jgi:hypothetical protein
LQNSSCGHDDDSTFVRGKADFARGKKLCQDELHFKLTTDERGLTQV